MKFSRYSVAGLLAAEIITLARFFVKRIVAQRKVASCMKVPLIGYLTGKKIRRGHKPNIVHRKLGKRSHFDILFLT